MIMKIFKKLCISTLLSLAQIPLMGLMVSTAFAENNQVTISCVNTTMYESWLTPNTVIVRRTGGLGAITIPLTLTGTATTGLDYISSVGSSITIPMGSREVWIQIMPLSDAITEGDETVTITLGTGTGFNVTQNQVQLTIVDKTVMSDQEAARFLIQAGFGADPDEMADVKALGFSGWIDAQIARPKGYLQPHILKMISESKPIYFTATKIALWTQVMRRRYPQAGVSIETDILRQRIAYSLLQIFVISQNVDALELNSEGVSNYYDKLMDGAFGNFRQLLYDITIHPVMGNYLSSVGNKKGDPETGSFPDENFAREIMQLFTIGLWELNNDGTRKLLNGQPIPSYTQVDIPQFAKVFTGLTYFGPDNGEEYKFNMDAEERYHDTSSKKLLNGYTVPAGGTTLGDINLALDNLFNHPNVGPFISRLLIQRLVKSNPTPAYIDRVATKFNNNGQGVRGDMGAVVKAILLDDEARNLEKAQGPADGKMREPYLTLMNMAKTFNAQSPSGDYEAATYMYEFYLQEPFEAPSVFNFYKPSDRPAGEITTMNLVAPEFKILTAVTALEAQNNLLNSVDNEISRWGAPEGSKMKLDFSQEIPLASNPDALIRQLSTRMVGAPLQPKTFQIIREAVLKITTSENNWELNRVKMAAYLIGASSEFNILK
ncbi:MAG: DUF1800 family protein [Sphingobacteriales bacterium]|nr:MAG: DUF1800 family protein [Sphingobacteriales bacterium]